MALIIFNIMQSRTRMLINKLFQFPFGFLHFPSFYFFPNRLMQFSQQFEVGFKRGGAVAASLSPPINQLHVRPRHVWQVIDLYKNMLHATARRIPLHSALQLVAVVVSSCCCGCFLVCLLLNLYSPPQPGDEEERSEPACLHIDYCAHSMPPCCLCNKIERA